MNSLRQALGKIQYGEDPLEALYAAKTDTERREILNKMVADGASKGIINTATSYVQAMRGITK